jgi:hypothetical protein
LSAASTFLVSHGVIPHAKPSQLAPLFGMVSIIGV